LYFVGRGGCCFVVVAAVVIICVLVILILLLVCVLDQGHVGIILALARLLSDPLEGNVDNIELFLDGFPILFIQKLLGQVVDLSEGLPAQVL
jgi:hypothetical protein